MLLLTVLLRSVGAHHLPPTSISRWSQHLLLLAKHRLSKLLHLAVLLLLLLIKNHSLQSAVDRTSVVTAALFLLIMLMLVLRT